MDVWLHVGAGKTGTSAIQAALAQGRERLAEAGLFYPPALNPVGDAIARAGGITSGNGLALGWMLNRQGQEDRFDAEATRAWLLRAMAEAGGRTVLFSSESMQQPLGGAVEPLLDLLSQGGRRRVRVLYFVRHALDYAVAGFAQLLKIADPATRGQALETSVATMEVPFRQQLESWAQAVGAAAVTCRLYEEDRPALVRRVLECVHPPAAEAWPDAAGVGTLVNRSPTPSELRLLHLLNAEEDAAALSGQLVRAVLNAPPAVPETLTIPAASFAAFAELNAPVLDAVNRDWLLPAGRTPVRLSAGRIHIGDPPPDDAARREAAFGATYIATVRLMLGEMGALRHTLRQMEGRLRKTSADVPASPRPQAAAAKAATAMVGGERPVQAAITAARSHADAGRLGEAVAVLAAAERAGTVSDQLQALRERLERRLARHHRTDQA